MVEMDDPEVDAPVEFALLFDVGPVVTFVGPVVTAPVDTPLDTPTLLLTFVGPVLTDVAPVDTPTPTVELPDLLTPDEVLLRLALLPEFFTPDALDDPLLRLLVELPDLETLPPWLDEDEFPLFFSELLWL